MTLLGAELDLGVSLPARVDGSEQSVAAVERGFGQREQGPGSNLVNVKRRSTRANENSIAVLLGAYGSLASEAGLGQGLRDPAQSNVKVA